MFVHLQWFHWSLSSTGTTASCQHQNKCRIWPITWRLPKTCAYPSTFCLQHIEEWFTYFKKLPLSSLPFKEVSWLKMPLLQVQKLTQIQAIHHSAFILLYDKPLLGAWTLLQELSIASDQCSADYVTCTSNVLYWWIPRFVFVFIWLNSAIRFCYNKAQSDIQYSHYQNGSNKFFHIQSNKMKICTF